MYKDVKLVYGKLCQVCFDTCNAADVISEKLRGLDPTPSGGRGLKLPLLSPTCPPSEALEGLPRLKEYLLGIKGVPFMFMGQPRADQLTRPEDVPTSTWVYSWVS